MRNLLIGLAIGFIVFFLTRSFERREVADREDALIDQIKTLVSINANLKTKRDTIKIEVEKWKTKIVTVRQESEEELEPIPNYQLTDSYDWVTNVYGFEGIELQPSAVAIENDPIKRIITDLVRGKYAQTELDLTTNLVGSLEADIIIADSIIANQDLTRKAHEQIIEIKSAEVRKERNAKNFWKVATPVALIGGVLLGTQIK